MIRVIVCGYTSFSDRKLCFKMLDRYFAGYDFVEIVSGHAKGADSFGEEYAAAHDIKLSIFRPE